MIEETRAREPLFNLPPVVTAMLAAMLAVHVLRANLSSDADFEILALFAFVPERLLDVGSARDLYPGGAAAQAWSFVTYAFIHADLTHLGVNLPMLAAFGTIVARRIGTARFLAFSMFTAAASAAVHLAAQWGDMVPVIGASGIVSGMMGAFVRFGLARGGGSASRAAGEAPPPLASLGEVVADPRARAFIGVFLLTNLLLVMAGQFLLGPGASIAWEAHLGGFFAGLVAFPLFDPVARR